MKTPILIILSLLLIWGITSSAYFLDETEQVVVTQFGQAIGKPITNAGLHFNLPWRKINVFPKNLLEWDGDPGQVPTNDKTFLWIDTFARWRISNALLFFERVGTTSSAFAKLDDIIDAAVRNLVTSNDLIETVRNTNRELGVEDVADSGVNNSSKVSHNVKLGRRKMTGKILEQARPKLNELGIELVDIKFKRINYNEKVLRDVYGRMIAERNQVAEKYRSEGRGESAKIKGEKEKELKRITSEAYRKAQEIKGHADAISTRIFANAYNRDPEFYSFQKTLEIYKTSLDSSALAILTTKSDFFKYLKNYGKASK